MEDDKLLRLEEVAVKLNIGVWTVRKLIDEGKLIAHKLGGQWRVPESSVDEFREKVTK